MKKQNKPNKKAQDLNCVRIYGKYNKDKMGNEIPDTWWVVEKNSNRKHPVKNIFDLAKLVDKYT